MNHIMIIVPHEDDEILMAAGVIKNALKENERVTVVIATNGDYEGTDKITGSVRLPETLAGLKVLGLSEDNVIFMGYADTGMNENESFLYQLYKEADDDCVLEGHCSRETYALENKREFHFSRYGEVALYTRRNFKTDLREIILSNKPDVIFTTSEEDMHGDHSGLFFFVRDILTEERKNHFQPILYSGVVHSKAGDTIWPERTEKPERYSCPPDFNQGSLKWEDRVSFEVPEEMKQADFNRNLKALALGKHKNALKDDAVDFLYSFMKSEEVFWKIKIGE